MRATIGPPAQCHSNGVLLTGRDNGPKLYSSWGHILTVIISLVCYNADADWEHVCVCACVCVFHVFILLNHYIHESTDKQTVKGLVLYWAVCYNMILVLANTRTPSRSNWKLLEGVSYGPL